MKNRNNADGTAGEEKWGWEKNKSSRRNKRRKLDGEMEGNVLFNDTFYL